MNRQQLAILAGTPGPAPFYGSNYAAIQGKRGRYEWTVLDPPSGRAVALERRSTDEVRTTVLALAMYTRPIPVRPGRILCWGPKGAPGIGLPIEIVVHELDDLEPLRFDTTRVHDLLRNQGQLVLASKSPIATLMLPPALSEGRHDGHRLAEAEDLEELLLVADGRDLDDAAYLVYVWRPRLGQVEVLPQRWFTARNFDLGYEWITRVARDPTTGLLIGDGIRIAPFELDQSGTRLLEPSTTG